MSTQDDAVVDPWVVLRRLMAENRALRQERDDLRNRVTMAAGGLRFELPDAPARPDQRRGVRRDGKRDKEEKGGRQRGKRGRPANVRHQGR